MRLLEIIITMASLFEISYFGVISLTDEIWVFFHVLRQSNQFLQTKAMCSRLCHLFVALPFAVVLINGRVGGRSYVRAGDGYLSAPPLLPFGPEIFCSVNAYTVVA